MPNDLLHVEVIDTSPNFSTFVSCYRIGEFVFVQIQSCAFLALYNQQSLQLRQSSSRQLLAGRHRTGFKSATQGIGTQKQHQQMLRLSCAFPRHRSSQSGSPENHLSQRLQRIVDGIQLSNGIFRYQFLSGQVF